MIDINILISMISLALLFILIVTKAYRRSISSTVYIIALVIALQCNNKCDGVLPSIIMMIGAIIVLIRAVLNHNTDTFLKRGEQ